MSAPLPPAGLPPQALAQFLRFARAKRAQHVREVAVHVADAAARVVVGDVYAGAEVRAALSELTSAVEKQVDEEVENAYHSSCLALHLVIQSAEAAGAAVELDTSALEDAHLLDGVRAAEAAAVAGPDLPRGSVRLASLDAPWLCGGAGGSSGGAAAGAELRQERDALSAELESLRARFQALQTSTTAAMRDKSELLRQLEAARDEAAAARREAAERGSAVAAAAAGEAGAAAAGAQKQLAAAQAETRSALDVAEAARAAAAAAEARLVALQQALRQKSGEAAALEAAAAERLAASKQFQQLQQLLKSKSQTVADLRRRLAKYEPHEHVESAD